MKIGGTKGGECLGRLEERKGNIGWEDGRGTFEGIKGWV